MTTGILPSEHGSYVVLATSIAVGLLSVDVPAGIPTLLACITVIGGFMAQQPLRTVLKLRRARRRARMSQKLALGGFATLACAASIVLAAMRPKVAPVLAAAVVMVAVLLAADRRRLSMTAQSIVGFVALTLAAPLVQLAGAGSLAWIEPTLLWLALTGFFTASALSVQLRIELAGGTTRAVTFHGIFLVASTIVCVAGGGTLPVVMATVACAKLACALADIDTYRRLTLRRIGLIETGASLVLVALAVTM